MYSLVPRLLPGNEAALHQSQQLGHMTQLAKYNTHLHYVNDDVL